MTGRLAVRCPAKVNLVLRVLGRRRDGYHELDTIFQAVDLWDRLAAAPAESISLRTDDPRLPLDERNLVVRAAARLRERYGRPGLGCALELSKSIPTRAGLGGGSSDAAGALLLCNRLWGLDLPGDRMRRLARELGADVPFFLTGGTARGRGRGDRIEPCAFAGEVVVLLGVPPFGIATAEAFSWLPARLTPPGNGVSVPLPQALKLPLEKDFGLLANDLERVVFERWPVLVGFRDALLEAGAPAAMLSGSGSTVFGMFPEPGAAARAGGLVRARFPDWRVVETRFVRGGVRWDEAEGRSG